MRFKFVKGVDLDLFNATQAVWQEQLSTRAADTSASFYEAHLGYFERIVRGEVEMGDGDGCVAAVVEDGKEHATALVDVAHARSRTPNPSLKLLNVVVQPSLNTADEEPSIADLSVIAATVILGCLEMTLNQYPSRELKIRSTFPLDKEFLGGIMASFAERSPEFVTFFEVSFHGSWLIVRRRGGS